MTRLLRSTAIAILVVLGACRASESGPEPVAPPPPRLPLRVAVLGAGVPAISELGADGSDAAWLASVAAELERSTFVRAEALAGPAGLDEDHDLALWLERAPSGELVARLYDPQATEPAATEPSVAGTSVAGTSVAGTSVAGLVATVASGAATAVEASASSAPADPDAATEPDVARLAARLRRAADEVLGGGGLAFALRPGADLRRAGTGLLFEASVALDPRGRVRRLRLARLEGPGVTAECRVVTGPAGVELRAELPPLAAGTLLRLELEAGSRFVQRRTFTFVVPD